jgi:Tol biopolymer transport system component
MSSNFVIGPPDANDLPPDSPATDHDVLTPVASGPAPAKADSSVLSPATLHGFPTGLGPYQIESLLGSGGMGEVYRARDIRLGRVVAIKVLRADLSRHRERRAEFASEARAVSALTHPHIRTVFDIGSESGLDFLVLEYLEGETLDHVLARRALPLARALTYAVQIADALDAAHRRGIVHGDVKPANIMVTAAGVKLLDFGLARLVTPAREPGDSTATDDGAIAGTTPYMAPERLEGGQADPRSDLFALGVVMYEMISGRRPFDGPTRPRIIAAILEHEPAPLSSPYEPVPAALQHLIARCLAKYPDERWQSARDLASDLQWIATHDAGSRNAATAPPKRRRIAPWAIAAALAAATLLVIGRFWRDPVTPAITDGNAVRFVVEAPYGPAPVAPAGFAVSPDGRHLVFVAPAGTGTRTLWLRSLDSFETRALPGTDDAWNPFWSADSQSVAFTAGTQLRRIDLATSRVQAIADMPSVVNGTWNRDGTIVVSATAGPTRLIKVPASGGMPIDIPLPAALRGATVASPSFLPDGRHFVYHARTASPATTGIYVTTLDGQEHRFLVASDSQANYADSGQLLFVRSGSMMAQPFDPQMLALTGAARPLPEPVSFVPGIDRAGFSMSRGSVLAYRGRVDSSELLWVDRTGRAIGSLASGTYINPALSPDGTRVAIARGDPTAGTADIWIIDSNRAMRQLTSAAGVENFPVWSPDAKRIVFSAERDGVLQIFEKDVNAGAADADEPVNASRYSKMPFDWSRDGRFVLFAWFQGGGFLGARLWTLPVNAPYESGHAAAGAADAIVSSSPGKEEGQGQISPDGRWLAYVSDITGSPQVFVRPFPHGPGRWLISTNGGLEPKWRADGRELFYLGSDQMMMSAEIAPGATFAAGPPRPLFRTNLVGAYLGSPFPNGRVRNEYAVTPDGQRFLINQPLGGASAYAVRLVVNWPALLN